MASKREILGGLASVGLHAGLLAWVVGHEPPPPEPPAPVPVEIELIELSLPSSQPLALEADSGREQDSPSPGLPRGEVVEPEPEPRKDPEPVARPRVSPPRAPEPVASDGPTEDAATSTSTEEPAPSTPTEEPGEDPGGARPWGTREATGSAGTGRGGLGTDGTPDHAAYGAELVRLIMTEIDEDPVPGLRSRDSIELELEVLPSGRLAHRGLGKYDYARVVRSTLGPIRLRAILRRVLRASEDFPPHPSSFPRERYVVGITVRFRDLRG